MSPCPKRKHSKARTRKGRSHQALSRVQLASCSHCGEPYLPHRVCPNCGYYGEQPVISPEGAA